MKKLNMLFNKSCRLLDMIAGFCVAGTMALVVINVILRTVFGRPFLGTYEYVGFLMAVMIGFSIPYCAILEGHIAVDFIAERLPQKIKVPILTMEEMVSFFFLTLVTWQLLKYGASIRTTGQVSLTTEIPIYPFIYLVTIGFFMLTLVLLRKVIKNFRGVIY